MIDVTAILPVVGNTCAPVIVIALFKTFCGVPGDKST
jgi:hypothetical protein